MVHHVTLETTAGGADEIARLPERQGSTAVDPPAAPGDGYRWKAPDPEGNSS